MARPDKASDGALPLLKMEMAIYHTGGVFSYLPHHLDLALEDSVGHSTCMSVLARRRATMELGLGLGLGLGYHGVVGEFLACCHLFAPPVWGFRCTRGST